VAFCLHRPVKLLLVLALLFSASGCVTLENRRDLYRPNVELYPHPATTKTVTRKTTTTTTTRETNAAPQPEFRSTAPEPEDSPVLPPP
jgi:hypothetical protein